MNKLVRLSPSGIEYLDYAWGFYSGCENWRNGVCPVGENCWAKKITGRFKSHYPNGFEPTYYPEAFLSPLKLKKPSRIGAAWMGDLFGDWVDPNMKMQSILPSEKASVSMSLKGWVFTTIEQCPQHTFLFLTKCPQNLQKWGRFPDNCWVGATATTVPEFAGACDALAKIDAKIRFISLEPIYDFEIVEDGLIEEYLVRCKINWVILGAQTKPTKYPKIEWVKEIVDAADRAGVPVFIKNNLVPLFSTKIKGLIDSHNLWAFKQFKLRQELPQ